VNSISTFKKNTVLQNYNAVITLHHQDRPEIIKQCHRNVIL